MGCCALALLEKGLRVGAGSSLVLKNHIRCFWGRSILAYSRRIRFGSLIAFLKQDGVYFVGSQHSGGEEYF